MKSEFERWSSKVIFSEKNDCWLWIGSTYRSNYGHFRRKINNKWVMGKAHRFSYEWYNKVSRESMKGFLVCHTCDNSSCVNPSHLYLGTTQDNIQDKIKRGRHIWGNNKDHNLLSHEIAFKIRTCKKENPKLTYKQIGKLFDTSASQVHRIIRNITWKIKEN